MLEVAAKRHLRFTGVQDGHIATFAIDSFSREGVEFELRYDLVTRELECSCENHTYVKCALSPVMDGERYRMCKHVALWRDWFLETVRRSEYREDHDEQD